MFEIKTKTPNKISSKNFLPLSKQWPNSVYSYNNKLNKNIPTMYSILNKLVNNYFNIVSDNSFLKDKYNPNINRSAINYSSLRVALELKNNEYKKSLNKIIVAKPEIKYTNDKLTVDLFVSNKQKEFYLRKLYFLSRALTLNSERSLKSIDHTSPTLLTKFMNLQKQNFPLFSEMDKGLLYYVYNNEKNNIIANISHKFEGKHKLSTKWRISDYKMKGKYLKSKIIISLLNKQAILKNNFYFSYLKWMLNKFNILVWKHESFSGTTLVLKIGEFTIKKIQLKSNNYLQNLIKINKLLLNLVIKSTVTFLALTENKFPNEVTSLNTIDKENYQKQFSSAENILNKSFSFFDRKYLNLLKDKFLRKERALLRYIYRDNINSLKFNGFIHFLKNFFSKIYGNLNIKINIVFLKYITHHSDLTTDAISTKLKNSTIGSLRIVRKFLGWAKLAKTNIYFTKKINTRKQYQSKLISSKLSEQFDTKKANYVGISRLSQIYSDKDINKYILDKINYKWVKGIKLETKGRLTKRYTASRSQYKFKYKGNLKTSKYKLNTISPVLRGDLKSNLIYSFKGSTRRIGAFGVKGWISTR